jgi:hypothetical protein
MKMVLAQGFYHSRRIGVDGGIPLRTPTQRPPKKRESRKRTVHTHARAYTELGTLPAYSNLSSLSDRPVVPVLDNTVHRDISRTKASGSSDQFGLIVVVLLEKSESAM